MFEPRVPDLPADEAAYREGVARDFDLLRRLLLEVIEDPARAEAIPDGSELVLFDANVAELDPAKVALAEQVEREGFPVARVMVR